MPLVSAESVKAQAAAEGGIDISIKGKWVRVPALNIHGNTIIVTGRSIKRALIAGEDYSERELDSPDLLIAELRRARVNGSSLDLFTFVQHPSTGQPKHKYPIEWESIAAVRTSSFKNWWEGVPHATRKSVRQSQKRGVVVKVSPLSDELINGIMGVNNDSAVRQGKAFVHYGKTFDEVKYDQSAFLDRSDFVCAYLDDELIGFLKMAYRGDVASLVQLLPKASHKDKRPANALLAKAIEVCEAKKISYLTYGYFNHGNKGNSSLREFKVHNGFGEILVPRFYVPLTTRGALYVRLKLYRGLVGVLPHSVIAAGGTARASWHSARQWMSRRDSTLTAIREQE